VSLDWPEFASALWKVNDQLGIRPEWQLAVIYLETAGTFDPSICNPYGCCGINQLCKSTYPHYVNVPVSEYVTWTASDQLNGPVFNYWRDALRSGPINSAGRLMLAQLSQGALARAPTLDSVVFSSPSAEYEQNKSFDTAGKNYITLRDLENAANAYMRYPAVQNAIARAYALRGYVAPRAPKISNLAVTFGVLALAAAAGYSAYKVRVYA
jgi:hypothetical protein